MQIVCVSRGTQVGGEALAASLAEKLGCECISREEVTDAATNAGIPVGKLEMAVMRRRPLDERMVMERERYKAFVTATLCERALEGSLVYHGRSGHMVLPGVMHVLRVRVVADPESRIEGVMQRLQLPRSKAVEYVNQVDEDRHRWVRAIYAADWDDPAHYDAVVNLSHMSAENGAVAMIAMSQLPEFQITPASRRALEDLHLGARCRLALGDHLQTRNVSFTVRADRGKVSVTYPPSARKVASLVPEIVARVEGTEEVLCTMASASLLWVEEAFDPQSEALPQVLDIAQRWNAAVELVQLVERGSADELAPLGDARDGPAQTSTTEDHGGILDDTEGDESVDDPQVQQTLDRLVSAGRAGGRRVVCGGAKEIVSSLDRSVSYSLVVVGDVHMSRDPSVRKRLTRETVGYLADSLRVPVVESSELRTQFLFGPAQWLQVVKLAVVFGLLLAGVFSYQEEVLTFLTREGIWRRILATICLFVVVPLFAYAYGNFSRHLLRLIKFE